MTTANRFRGNQSGSPKAKKMLSRRRGRLPEQRTGCQAASSRSVLLSGLNEGLLRDEDSVEELTLVLAADSADLLDSGAALGEESKVIALEDELTLLLGAEPDDGASLHVNEFVLLATEEVLDGDAGTILGDGDVDGEMSVHKSHFVAVAL